MIFEFDSTTQNHIEIYFYLIPFYLWNTLYQKSIKELHEGKKEDICKDVK